MNQPPANAKPKSTFNVIMDIDLRGFDDYGRETLVEAILSTSSTFAGTALRALHRVDPSDPLVASNALRIALDSSYPSTSRTTALLVLEKCSFLCAADAAVPPEGRLSVLRETALSVSANPAASSLLRQTAEAVLKRKSSD